jgi:hypothetical protein
VHCSFDVHDLYSCTHALPTQVRLLLLLLKHRPLSVHGQSSAPATHGGFVTGGFAVLGGRQ